MKVYYNFGNDDFSAEEFRKYIFLNDLEPVVSTIVSLGILERKLLSNKGNALDGMLTNGTYHYGINIGGNPIGTGYKNYIEFLDEMGCKKIANLYVVKSLIGKSLLSLSSNDRSIGYVTPKGLSEIVN